MPYHSLSKLESLIDETATVATDIHVERGKVAEFAHAIRDENPVYHNESAASDAGFETIPAPLTFSRIFMFDRHLVHEGSVPFDLGFDEHYTVHGEQEYVYERPVVVGDTLEATATLTDVYQRERDDGSTMTFAKLEMEFCDENDDLVLTSMKTIIETTDPTAEDGGERDD